MNGSKLEKGIAKSLNSGDQLDLIDPSIAEGKVFTKVNLCSKSAACFQAEIHTNTSGCPNHLSFKVFFDGGDEPATLDY